MEKAKEIKASAEVEGNKNKQQLILQKQTNAIKHYFHESIQKKNDTQFLKIINLFQIEANEELSSEGCNWTTIHYCCHFKRDAYLKYLLIQTFRNNQEQYQNIVNLKTSEGYTALMICGLYKSEECLQVLFDCGGINLLEKDNNKKTAVDLANKYGNTDIKNQIQKKIEENDYQEIMPINYQFFQKFASVQDMENLIINNEDIDDNLKIEYHDLLINGKRLPCVICLSNKGYLKYSTCCGQPIHQICCQNLVKCPYCHFNSIELINIIKHPNRAFILE